MTPNLEKLNPEVIESAFQLNTGAIYREIRDSDKPELKKAISSYKSGKTIEPTTFVALAEIVTNVGDHYGSDTQDKSIINDLEYYKEAITAPSRTKKYNQARLDKVESYLRLLVAELAHYQDFYSQAVDESSAGIRSTLHNFRDAGLDTVQKLLGMFNKAESHEQFVMGGAVLSVLAIIGTTDHWLSRAIRKTVLGGLALGAGGYLFNELVGAVKNGKDAIYYAEQAVTKIDKKRVAKFLYPDGGTEEEQQKQEHYSYAAFDMTVYHPEFSEKTKYDEIKRKVYDVNATTSTENHLPNHQTYEPDIQHKALMAFSKRVEDLRKQAKKPGSKDATTDSNMGYRLNLMIKGGASVADVARVLFTHPSIPGFVNQNNNTAMYYWDLISDDAEKAVGVSDGSSKLDRASGRAVNMLTEAIEDGNFKDWYTDTTVFKHNKKGEPPNMAALEDAFGITATSMSDFMKVISDGTQLGSNYATLLEKTRSNSNKVFTGPDGSKYIWVEIKFDPDKDERPWEAAYAELEKKQGSLLPKNRRGPKNNIKEDLEPLVGGLINKDRYGMFVRVGKPGYVNS